MGVIQPSWAPRTSRLITIPMTLEKPPVLTCLHWWQQKNDGKTTTKCCDCSAKRMNPKYGLVWNYGAKLWGLNHQFPHEHVPYLGGFAGLPSCWALLVSLGSGQPEPRNICIAKGLRLDLFQDLKSETSETSETNSNFDTWSLQVGQKQWFWEVQERTHLSGLVKPNF